MQDYRNVRWLRDRPKTKDSLVFFRGRCALPCGVSFGSADGPHLAATSASAVEQIAAIGLEPGYGYSRRHLDPLQNLSRFRIDSPQIAPVTFPGAVPQLSVDPRDPGNQAIGLDRAKYRSGLGIDLIDLSVAILPHPERPFGPREPRASELMVSDLPKSINFSARPG
jgi:hypothetical protein